jgi:hypothetical protein
MPTPGQPRFDPPPPSVRDRDSIGVRWSAHDDNDDQMEYSLYYRGDGETRWLLLKSGLSDRYYSFDASLLPDGGYTAMVDATDSPSHSPGEALSSQRESSRFEVDTTPPAISALNAAVEGTLRVHFHAAIISSIKRAGIARRGRLAICGAGRRVVRFESRRLRLQCANTGSRDVGLNARFKRSCRRSPCV